MIDTDRHPRQFFDNRYAVYRRVRLTGDWVSFADNMSTLIGL